MTVPTLSSVASGCFYQCDAALEFLLADEARDGFACLLEAGEIPKVWKIAALLRLHGLRGAIVAGQENAAAIGFFQQRQAAPVLSQSRKILDEFTFAHALERGEPGDFLIRQTHLSRPAAAGGASPAFVKIGMGD